MLSPPPLHVLDVFKGRLALSGIGAEIAPDMVGGYPMPRRGRGMGYFLSRLPAYKGKTFADLRDHALIRIYYGRGARL